MTRALALRATLAATLVAAVVGVVPTTAGLAPAACAAGDIRVAVVIDAGNGGGVSAVCVPAGTRDNGATVLAARASALGRPQPRYASSGLLCAIDGFPKTGCGVRNGSHYAYWAYFHGRAGAWSYQNIGPAGSRVHADVVEGWRWQPAGAGSPVDPAPRGSATATATCVPAPPITAAPPPTRPPATVRGAGRPPATGGRAATAPQSTVATDAGGTAVTTTSPPVAGSTVTRPSAQSSVAPSSSSLNEQGVAARLPQSGSSGDPPVGLIVGAVLIAALAAGGFVAARRRSRARS